MTAKSPTAQFISTAIDLDAAIRNMQVKLIQLDWLEKSYGRARMFWEEFPEGLKVKMPKAHESQGEYTDVLRNDNLTAHSYFMVDGPQTPIDYNAGFPFHDYRAKVSIIFQFNLKKIDKNRNYYFTEELKNQILALLSMVPQFHVERIYDEREEDIFREVFSQTRRNMDKVVDLLSASGRLHLMYPKAALRIEGELAYKADCTNSSLSIPITAPASSGALAWEDGVITHETGDILV